jgi:hypothetical protein
LDEINVTLQSGDGKYKRVPGQIIENEKGEHQLWWILPETSQDNPAVWTATLTKSTGSGISAFNWQDTPGKHLDLLLNEKPAFRYSYEMDNKFVKGETLTALNKPFYHIYDEEGKEFITNGPEEGVHSHQRGIMIGWKRLGYQDQQLSFWGMEDLTVQKPVQFVENIAGPVLAQTKSLIHWNDSTGATLIRETRLATVYRQSHPGMLVLDFSSTLSAPNGPVILDGDPEHGGVQFRAHNDVAEEAEGSEKPTYHFHNDTIDPRQDYNLPWVAMSYGLRNKIYTVLEIDHPQNPDSTIWSAYRDYGRFGPFFRKNLEEGESLTLHYRFWIGVDTVPGREMLSSMAAAYKKPPEIKAINP